jgi:hypothetical protein
LIELFAMPPMLPAHNDHFEPHDCAGRRNPRPDPALLRRLHLLREPCMPSLLARPTLRIAEPDPFGDVTLVPSPLTGKPETEAARTLARDDIAPRPAPRRATACPLPVR